MYRVWRGGRRWLGCVRRVELEVRIEKLIIWEATITAPLALTYIVLLFSFCLCCGVHKHVMCTSSCPLLPNSFLFSSFFCFYPFPHLLRWPYLETLIHTVTPLLISPLFFLDYYSKHQKLKKKLNKINKKRGNIRTTICISRFGVVTIAELQPIKRNHWSGYEINRRLSFRGWGTDLNQASPKFESLN